MSLDVERFVAERRARWEELEKLLSEAESLPEKYLGIERVERLVRLYRQVSSDLNQARSATANPLILSRLNQLAGSAYRFVYRGGSSNRPKGALARFAFFEVPATFRREHAVVLAAALSLLLGALFGAGAVLIAPEKGERLIPRAFFTESPRQRVDRIEKGEERIDGVGDAAAFGASLYTHNIEVSFLAFSLGALTIVGGVLLLFYNGVILGAVAATYLMDGVSVFFLAWVGPHGALEIPAIVFCGAAGLKLGRALLLPGDVVRGASAKLAFPAVFRMISASAAILVVAGLIEGSFSQLSTKVFPYSLKIGVAALLLAGLLFWLFGPARGRKGP